MKYIPHHIAISVKDLDLSIDFYTKFGFIKVQHWIDDNKSLQIVNMKLNGLFLELFCYIFSHSAPETSFSIDSDLIVRGVKHFALQVNSIESAKEHLISEGLAKDSVLEITEGRTGTKYFFLHDPDGILLEIVEDKRNL